MKYELVSWPEVQAFMNHDRWNECIFCIEIEGHPVPDSTYAIPEDLYEEVLGSNFTKNYFTNTFENIKVDYEVRI